jgi:lysozyme family protein
MATANHGTNAQTHPDTTNRDAALDNLEAVAEAYLSLSVPSIPTLERLHDLEDFYGYSHAIPRRPLTPYLPLSSVCFEDCMAALHENVEQLK